MSYENSISFFELLWYTKHNKKFVEKYKYNVIIVNNF